MNILITGGTGLIGRCFIEQFNDYQYTVLTRSPSRAKSKLPASVELITSLDNISNLDAFDAVINLAGEPIIDKRWSSQQKIKICQSRWQTTQRLVELFAGSEQPPAVFLSGSAIGIYGNRGDQKVTESDVIEASDFATELCTRWEKIATQATPYTRVVMLRTGIVLAVQGGALAKMLLPFKCYLGGQVGNGKQFMSWIHYQDHVHAMHYLLTQNNLSGAVNLVAPEPETNRVFTQTLATLLHRFAVFTMPAKVLHCLLGESSCLLLDSQRVIPQVLIEHGFKFRFPKLSQALTDVLKNRG